MRQKIAAREEATEKAAETCRHHWKIEAADGPESRGVCKHCGEARDFPNSMPDFSEMKKARRRDNPLELPKMDNVEVEEESLS